MRTLPTTRVQGVCLVGVDAVSVTVEGRFEPSARSKTEVVLTGLPDAVVRESRTRVLAALVANRLDVPAGRLYLNLAPAGFKKTGEALDLPLALCAATACGHLAAGPLSGALFLGELGIDGRLQDVPGGLAAAELARARGWGVLVGPPGTAAEAAHSQALALSARSLAEVVRWASRGAPTNGLERAQPAPLDEPSNTHAGGGLDAIRGQAAAKRALAVAAAGRHALLLLGPPGTGKSLLARGLLRLLPPLSSDELLDVARIRSAIGRWHGTLAAQRPFRAPHHSTSPAGLIGGGNPIVPGEITLAHRGLLFLDELPEFRRETLEALRQPVESGRVLIARAGRQVELPAHFRWVAAMNPCPCGYRGHGTVPCRCSPAEVHRYRRRISGPLLDRVELRVEVPAPSVGSLVSEPARDEREAHLLRAVTGALRRAERRQGSRPNGELDARELDVHAPLSRRDRALLERIAEHRALSARAIQSVRRVARTIADLDDSERVEEQHLAEAVALRAPLFA